MPLKISSKLLIVLSIWVFCCYSLLSVMPVKAEEGEDFSTEAILERIKPVGEPTVLGETKKAAEEAQSAASQTTATPVALTGEQIYTQYCSVCHAIGVAGAPKFHDKSAWDARGGKKAVDVLVKSAIKGKNAMPPNGNCMTCKEVDIHNAVLYMMSE